MGEEFNSIYVLGTEEEQYITVYHNGEPIDVKIVNAYLTNKNESFGRKPYFECCLTAEDGREIYLETSDWYAEKGGKIIHLTSH